MKNTTRFSGASGARMKQDKEQIRTLALKLMDKHGLLAKQWRFAFYTGNHVGSCNYGKRLIGLSNDFALAAKITRREIRNTILHEIAHALCPKDDHGSLWRKTCIAIGGDGVVCADKGTSSVVFKQAQKRLGAKLRRAEKRYELEGYRPRPDKYGLFCPRCKSILARYKRRVSNRVCIIHGCRLIVLRLDLSGDNKE